MIRYQVDFQNEYFVEYFRRSAKLQSRTLMVSNSDVPEQFISVCTTCMNRLRDLRITLPKNIEDNASYLNAEFILLDYGSVDGLLEWVTQEMRPHLESGRLRYYRTKQDYFRPNHSRNTTFRLARGKIITNVDADNFMHPGFLKRINQCASLRNDRLIILPESFLKPGSDRLILRGRFAIYRDDLIRLGGFDEDLDNGYSHDDVNFVFRALLNGFYVARFEDLYLRDRLTTSDAERAQHVRTKSFEGVKIENARKTAERLGRCELLVNRGREWGVSKFEQVLQPVGAGLEANV
jgi:glycosyltransferase involved in cell wall biosynthesis